MEVELNEQKHFCIMPFEGSKETQSVELNECRTLLKFVIIKETATSNEKRVLWKCSVVLCETVVENMGWKIIAVEKEHNKQLTNMTLKMEISDRQRQLVTNSKDQ